MVNTNFTNYFRFSNKAANMFYLLLGMHGYFWGRPRIMVETSKISDQDALDFHAQGKPGKLEMALAKSLTTQRDL